VWEERVNNTDITTIGRGTIGGGLARLWEQAGHNVTTLGREGGDASDAEVVFVAVPSGSISEALGNANFGVLYDRIGEQRVRPSCLYAGEDGAREVTEQPIRDAGYEPVSVGGIENARALEDFVPGVFAQIGQVFYRFAPPGELWSVRLRAFYLRTCGLATRLRAGRGRTRMRLPPPGHGLGGRAS
jgi:hypothetical protein